MNSVQSKVSGVDIFVMSTLIVTGGHSLPSPHDLPVIALLVKYINDHQNCYNGEISRVTQDDYFSWRKKVLHDYCTGWANYMVQEKYINANQRGVLFDANVESHKLFPKDQEAIRRLSVQVRGILIHVLKNNDLRQMLNTAQTQMTAGRRNDLTPEQDEITVTTKLLQTARGLGIPFRQEDVTYVLNGDGKFIPTQSCVRVVSDVKEKCTDRLSFLTSTLKFLQEHDVSLAGLTSPVQPVHEDQPVPPPKVPNTSFSVLNNVDDEEEEHFLSTRKWI